jgi:hypothetical protein
MKAGNKELYAQPDTVQNKPILQLNKDYLVLQGVINTVYILHVRNT